MGVLAAILLVAAVVAIVLLPLARSEGAALTDGPDRVAELRELYNLRDVTYETLRDLEYDFHAGKIGEADFRDLTARYKREAVAIVGRIDGLEAAFAPAVKRGRGGT